MTIQAKHFTRQGLMLAAIQSELDMYANAMEGDILFVMTPATLASASSASGEWTRDVVITVENAAGTIHTWFTESITTGVSVADTSSLGEATIESTTLVFVQGTATVTVTGDDAAWANGSDQEETIQATGDPTADGDITMTITAAGMPNSPKAVVIGILDADDAAGVAVKVGAAFTSDADVSGFFDIDVSVAVISLIVKATAANDATMDIGFVDTDTTGVTFGASTAATAGVADETDTLTVAEATILGYTIVAKTSVETFSE